MERGRGPRWDVIDDDVPNLARMNNYLLGGKDHYRADREACERLVQIAPAAVQVAEAADRFLLRATSCLAREYRVRQFVVFGCGLPTPVGVHKVAQHINVGVRVVYVDDDPLVLVHGRALWEDRRRTMVVRGDLLQAGSLLLRAEVRQLIDLTSPVAVLLVSAMHTIPDLADPARVLEQIAGVLAPGSFIAASHLVSEDVEVRQQADAVLREAARGRWGRVRPRSQIEPFFGSLRLMAPGLVDVHQWRPGSDRGAGAGNRAWAEHGAVAMVR